MKLSRLSPVFLAFSLSGIFYLLQSNVHLNWADEGFLWYGVIHTRLGEIPIRDFQSYDPFRYYWCAAFGDSILGLRRAEWLFQAIGLSFGLAAMRRVIKTMPVLAAAAVLLILWQLSAIRNFDSHASVSCRERNRNGIMRRRNAGIPSDSTISAGAAAGRSPALINSI